MVRLGQIIVICFLRPTDAIRTKTRTKKESRGEEQVLSACEAAENRLHQGKKNKSAKNTTSSSSSHPPSLHPSYQRAHTNTHTPFVFISIH